MTHKEALRLFCQNFARRRTVGIQENIREIQESLLSETKSSAGDKHETGRAMLQLEREKLGRQLAEAEKMNLVLSKIPLKNSKMVALGSLVKTTKANYYLAISAGACTLGDLTVFCVSTMTPMGKALLGKSEGDTFVFSEEEIKILAVA